MRNIFFLVFTSLCFLTSPSFPQSPGNKTVAKVFLSWDAAWNALRPEQRTELAWIPLAMRLKWTVSDKKFLEEAKTIDAQLKTGNATEIYNRYQEQVTKQPNAVSRFGWTYVAWKRHLRGESIRSTFPPVSAMGSAYIPSYAYTKLLFTIQYLPNNNPSPKLLEPIGQRLLKTRPNDLQLQYYLAKRLSGLPTASAKNQSLGIMRKFVVLYPKNQKYWYDLALIYDQWWTWNFLAKRNSLALKDGNAAIVAYQKSISLSPPNSKWSKEYGPEMVKRIVDWKAKNGY